MVTGLVLGLLLGMRHALEPDHLAAVSTLIGARGSRAGTALGVVWGLGHSAALLAVGGVLSVLHAGLPAVVAEGFELLVGLMLLTLGARAIARGARRGAAAGPGAAHVHLGGWTLARQPLLVGLVHGLAGSGALTALVLANMPTPATRLGYMALFAAGSILGMGILTGIAGWSLARLGRSAPVSRVLSAVTGGFSVALGGWWSWSVAGAWLGS